YRSISAARLLILFFVIRRPLTPTLFPYTDALPIFAIPVQTQPFQAVDERGHGCFGRAFAIGIFNAQQHLAALVLGKGPAEQRGADRKSTRLNSSHVKISYAVFCLKKKKNKRNQSTK